MNHYPRHVGDWMRDTAHLSEVEECVYSRMLDQYYSREQPLPADQVQVCRLVRASSTAARKAVAQVLGEFFALEPDGWHQKRCDEEIAKYRERSDAAKRSADIGWTKRNANAYANASKTQSVGNANQEPVTSNQKPEPLAAVSLPSVEILSPNPVAASAKKAAAAPQLSPEKQAQARAVWQAYSDAYLNRYGTEPVRNAKTNAAVVQLLTRLPADEAPHIAAHFVGSSATFYVAKGHSITMLLADAEKLRTEWATNRRVTQSEARQADATQARGNVFGRLIENAKDGTHG